MIDLARSSSCFGFFKMAAGCPQHQDAYLLGTFASFTRESSPRLVADVARLAQAVRMAARISIAPI